MAFGFSVVVHLSLLELFLCWFRVVETQGMATAIRSCKPGDWESLLVHYLRGKADALVVVKTSNFVHDLTVNFFPFLLCKFLSTKIIVVVVWQTTAGWRNAPA